MGIFRALKSLVKSSTVMQCHPCSLHLGADSQNNQHTTDTSSDDAPVTRRAYSKDMTMLFLRWFLQPARAFLGEPAVSAAVAALLSVRRAAPLVTLQGARAAGAISTVGGRGWRRGSYVPLPVLMPMPARARRTATHLSVVTIGLDLVVDLGLSSLLAVAVH